MATVVALLGAGGTMGAAMARNLAAAGITACASRFAEAAKEHGDEDIAAVYLASAPKG